VDSLGIVRITLGSAAKSISRVELNSKKRPRMIVDEIHAALQRVFADRLGEVVAKLPFFLPGLLRNVGVGANEASGKVTAAR